MENIKTTGRNYGIDLMRMVAMFFVTILHVLGQGGILNGAQPMSVNYWVSWFMEIAAFCAVNCYALISGYVGVNSRYKYSGIILLWLRVVFYTLFITGVFRIVFPETVSGEHWKNAFFPVMTGQYWYFTAYFAMFFFIPLINKAIGGLTQKQSRALVISLLFVFSVLTTIFYDVFGASDGYSALWLIVLYIIGAHMKKYDTLRKISMPVAIIGYVVTIFLTWLFKVMVETGVIGFVQNGDALIKYISPTIVASAIFLFAFFEKIKIPAFVRKVISVMSPAAFSVYLIHTHPLIWLHFMTIRFQAYASMPVVRMIIYVLGAALAIYIACTVVDLIREAIFSLLKIKKLMAKIEQKLTGDIWTKE